MKPGIALLALCLTAPAFAQDITEPRSGVTFSAKSGDMTLLGTAIRTKTFLKVKVYAIGLYVADSAITGPLAAHKGKFDTPAFYKELVSGEFPRQINMKFVRDVTAEQIQDAFRESLAAANKSRVDAFVGYFGYGNGTKSGQEYVLQFLPGGVLETTVAGQKMPAITDKDFSAAVAGIWLGANPIQEDIKKGLVGRAAEIIK